MTDIIPLKAMVTGTISEPIVKLDLASATASVKDMVKDAIDTKVQEVKQIELQRTQHMEK